MFKKLFLGICLACFVSTTQAQQLEVGDNVGSFGIGFGSALAGPFGSASPAIALQLEHGMWNMDGPGVISLGGYLGYQSYSTSNIYFKTRSSYTVLGLRSAYHYQGLDEKNLDVYGGLMLSLNLYGSSTTRYNTSVVIVEPDARSRFFPTLYFGARYYFADNLAAYGELGYGVAYLTVGLAYHF